MPEISKAKLRRIPYNSRLTLALSQADYIEEIARLFEDYPDYDHTIAQTELMKKCSCLRNTVKCFKINFINFPQLIDTIAEQIVNEYLGPNIHSSGIYDIINRELIIGIDKFSSHPYFQEAVLKIINSLLKCYHRDVTLFSLLLLISRYCKCFGSLPGITDEVVRQLLPRMYDTNVMELFQQLLKIGIHDKQLRDLIYDSINIRDIIT